MSIFISTDEFEDEEEASSEVGTGSAWDADHFWKVVRKSHVLSLLQSLAPGTAPDGDKFSLHPLIRNWLQLREEVEGRRKDAQEGIEVVLSCVKAYESWGGTVDQKMELTAHMDMSMSNDR